MMTASTASVAKTRTSATSLPPPTSANRAITGSSEVDTLKKAFSMRWRFFSVFGVMRS